MAKYYRILYNQTSQQLDFPVRNSRDVPLWWQWESAKPIAHRYHG